MNDTELANRVVAQGVGHRIDLKPPHSGTAWAMFEDDLAFLTAESFVRDWRVAGALMEKCSAIFIEDCTDGVERVKKYACRADHSYGRRTREWYSDKSLPRAIILACVEALE